jgi:myosin heavy subunit
MNFDTNFGGQRVILDPKNVEVNEREAFGMVNIGENKEISLKQLARSTNPEHQQYVQEMTNDYVEMAKLFMSVRNDTEKMSDRVQKGFFTLIQLCKDPGDSGFAENLNETQKSRYQEQMFRQATAIFMKCLFDKHMLLGNAKELEVAMNSMKKRDILNKNSTSLTANSLALVLIENANDLLDKHNSLTNDEDARYLVEICNILYTQMQGLHLLITGMARSEMSVRLYAQEKEEADKEKAVKETKKAAEKAEKEAKKAAEKAEKETKKAAEKAEKEAKKAAEKAEKEAKKAAEKAEKAAKKAAEKAEKAAKKAAKKAANNQAKAAKKAADKEAVYAAMAAKKANMEAKRAALTLRKLNSGLVTRNHEANFQKLVNKYGLKTVTTPSKEIRKSHPIFHIVKAKNGRHMVVTQAEKNAGIPLNFRPYKHLHEEFLPSTKGKVATLRYLKAQKSPNAKPMLMSNMEI